MGSAFVTFVFPSCSHTHKRADLTGKWMRFALVRGLQCERVVVTGKSVLLCVVVGVSSQPAQFAECGNGGRVTYGANLWFEDAYFTHELLTNRVSAAFTFQCCVLLGKCTNLGGGLRCVSTGDGSRVRLHARRTTYRGRSQRCRSQAAKVSTVHRVDLLLFTPHTDQVRRDTQLVNDLKGRVEAERVVPADDLA